MRRGELLAWLFEAAFPGQRLGVDIFAPDLALASARLPAAYFMLARAQALPFADRSMDVVVCHMALMLMDDPDVVLAECRRMLRPNGTFAAIVNRPTEPDALARTILDALRDALRSGDITRRPPTIGDPARTMKSR